MQGGKISKLLKTSISADVLSKFLDILAKDNLYDIHIEPSGSTYKIRTRLNGRLRLLDKVSRKTAEDLISQLKAKGGVLHTSINIPQEAVFTHGSLTVRLFSLPTLDGEKTYLRVINQKATNKDLSKLGLYGESLKQLEAISKMGPGLIIVLGEGKTTTMFSLLSQFDASTLSLSTIERHASYKLSGVNQFIAGDNYYDLAYDAFVAAINQRSDVILVDDIGTPDLAKLAVDSVHRGKLVIASLPVNDSFAAAHFLASLGIKPFLVASSLKIIVRQRIIHTGITTQLEPRPVSANESAKILRDYGIEAEKLHKLEGQAKQAGLNEKLPLSTSSTAINKLFDLDTEKMTKITGVFEVVAVDDAFRHLYLAGASEQDLRDNFISSGGIDIRLSYIIKALRKIVPFLKLE